MYNEHGGKQCPLCVRYGLFFVGTVCEPYSVQLTGCSSVPPSGRSGDEVFGHHGRLRLGASIHFVSWTFFFFNWTSAPLNHWVLLHPPVPPSLPPGWRAQAIKSSDTTVTFAEAFQDASILFVEIAHFNEIVTSSSPSRAMELLNSVFWEVRAVFSPPPSPSIPFWIFLILIFFKGRV